MDNTILWIAGVAIFGLCLWLFWKFVLKKFGYNIITVGPIVFMLIALLGGAYSTYALTVGKTAYGYCAMNVSTGERVWLGSDPTNLKRSTDSNVHGVNKCEYDNFSTKEAKLKLYLLMLVAIASFLGNLIYNSSKTNWLVGPLITLVHAVGIVIVLACLAFVIAILDRNKRG